MPRAAGSILVALVAVLVIPPSVMAAKAERHTARTPRFCGELRVRGWQRVRQRLASDGGDASPTWLLGGAGRTRRVTPSPGTGGRTTHVIADRRFDARGHVRRLRGRPVRADRGTVEPGVHRRQRPCSASLTASGRAGDRSAFNDQLGQPPLPLERLVRSATRRRHPRRCRVPFRSILVAATASEVDRDAGSATARPHSVSHSTELRLSCSWEFDDGFDHALFAASTDFGRGLDLVSNGDMASSTAAAIASLSRSAFDTTFRPVPGLGRGADPVGSASACAVLTGSTDQPQPSRSATAGSR